MFVILDDEHIFDVNDTVKIGSAPECTIPVNPGPIQKIYAHIIREKDDRWTIANPEGEHVLQNSNLIGPRTKAYLENEDEVQVDRSRLLILFEESRLISAGIDDDIVKAQNDLHQRILDKALETNEYSSSASELRNFVNQQADIELDDPVIEKGIFFPLLKRAVKKVLLTRIGRETVSKTTRNTDPDLIYENGTFKDAAAETYIETAERYLQLDHVSGDAEKRKRVNILISWAVNKLNEFDRDTLKLIIKEYLKTELEEMIFGLGPLQEIIDSYDVNDIMVLPSGHIFVDRGGQMEDSGIKILTSEISLRIIERIVSSAERRIDQTSPMVDAKLVSDGSRLNAVIEPVSVNGPTLTIRKFSDRRITITDLINGIDRKPPALTETAANFLEACVLAKKNIVISGGTGSGKTTLLSALCSLIPETERIVVIEDTTEINVAQKHVVQLQAKPANLEGKYPIDIRRLVRNALRMRPDRIIVGECRGQETLDMLQAMNTGHDGSGTTVHANSPADALRRIEVMALEAEGIDLPSRAIREQIASAIHVIVQISRFSKSRKVMSISEVVEYNDEKNEIVIEEVFRFRGVKKSPELTVPELAFAGYIPTFAEELLKLGRFNIEDIF